MRKHCHAFGLILFLVTTTAVADTPQGAPKKAVLDRVVEISQQNALNTLKVDWPSVVRTSTEILEKDNTDTGLSASIRYVLSKLQDHHSSYRPSQVKTDASKAQSPAPIATSSLTKAGTPILAINSWSGRDARSAATQARHELITALDQKKCGMILDFSQNGGGNMWPMVMGVLPLLTEGTLGAFEDRDAKRTSIVSTGNGLLVAGSPHFLNAPSLPLPSFQPDYIAIVLGPRTASSGEITALLFKGQSNVRFFGQRTAGVPTANRVFPLPNGGTLALTTSVTLDRNGNKYSAPIVPDLVTDEPIDAAGSWINNACSKNVRPNNSFKPTPLRGAA